MKRRPPGAASSCGAPIVGERHGLRAAPQAGSAGFRGCLHPYDVRPEEGSRGREPPPYRGRGVIAGLTPQVLVRLPSNVRYGMFFLVPFVVALCLTPWLARFARRVGILDQPGSRKLHLEATPYLGGLAVVAGLCAAGLATGGTSRQVITIVGCGAAIAVLGLLDDWPSQGPPLKLAVGSRAG